MTIQELADRGELPLKVSVEEAGRMLGISRSAACRAVRTGDLPALRVGGRLLVPSVKLLGMLGLAQPQRP